MFINSKEALLEQFQSYDFCIVDNNVYQLNKELFSHFDNLYMVDEPEKYKKLSYAEKMIDFFLSKGIKRTDELLVVGGGAVSDLGGFVASIILRGIPWSVAPTTLLSVIDASIGGKTGVNSSQGKNLIGSFHQPSKHLVYLNFMETLPTEEINSGKGELLKYFFLDENISKFDSVYDWIQMSRDFKFKIVEDDYKEKGKRALLNLGHTLGHGIEFLLKVPHGIAVAYGILLNISLFSPEKKLEFDQYVKQINLKLPHLDKMNIDQFIEVLTKDKKRQTDDIPIVGLDLKMFDIEPQKLKKLLLTNENTKNFFN